MVLCQVNECEIVTPNKKFKPDYQRAAESVPKWFCDYGALLKVTLCVGSSLIWRYSAELSELPFDMWYDKLFRGIVLKQ